MCHCAREHTAININKPNNNIIKSTVSNEIYTSGHYTSQMGADETKAYEKQTSDDLVNKETIKEVKENVLYVEK